MTDARFSLIFFFGVKITVMEIKKLVVENLHILYFDFSFDAPPACSLRLTAI